MIVLNQVSLTRPLGRVSTIRVLNDVTFELSKGDRIALIGSNGSGKTTLLRLLAGIFPPSSGTLYTPGDIEFILDSGFGLDLWLSGLENARTRLAISGVRRDQISSNISWIRDFSGLGEAFERPVRTYSSGMLARLAFSITCLRSHQVLLIDEGFGTLDAEFQARARRHLDVILHQTAVLVLASHNVEMLREYCNKGILLIAGRVLYFGELDAALEQYSVLVKQSAVDLS